MVEIENNRLLNDTVFGDRKIQLPFSSDLLDSYSNNNSYVDLGVD